MTDTQPTTFDDVPFGRNEGDPRPGAGGTEPPRWVDPARCRMWARHNRAYDLLTEEPCRDLIDGIRSQGRQEFPAIVRATGDASTPLEVICGARRHFAVGWLRANGLPRLRFLVEVRDLSDEAAFRLADIENRDRADISDLERARDYAAALERYYGGRQKDMAARLEVSDAWLSRYLRLARLPSGIVDAFPSIREVREAHARALAPHLRRDADRAALLAEAASLKGRGLDAASVMRRLRAVVAKPAAPRDAAKITVFRGASTQKGMVLRRKGRRATLEFDDRASRAELEQSFAAFVAARFGR